MKAISAVAVLCLGLDPALQRTDSRFVTAECCCQWYRCTGRDSDASSLQ